MVAVSAQWSYREAIEIEAGLRCPLGALLMSCDGRSRHLVPARRRRGAHRPCAPPCEYALREPLPPLSRPPSLCAPSLALSCLAVAVSAVVSRVRAGRGEV